MTETKKEKYKNYAKKFIKKSKEIHQNKYIYEIQSMNSMDKVEIICPIHGGFWQRPYTHLRGSGCRECANINKISNNEKFKTKAVKVHGNKYLYDKIKYQNSITEIEIICPTCGSFWQKPNYHLQGHGCPACFQKKVKLNTTQFLSRARKTHGNKYGYHKCKYKNTTFKVEIVCPEHGSFWQKPNDHFNGRGCPGCAVNRRKKALTKSKEKFTHEADQVHNKFYNYTEVDYTRSTIPIKIICPEHGSFRQTPNSHLMGAGCPGCANHGFNPKKPGYLYYLLDLKTGFYKLGISNNINKRFPKSRIRILKTWVFERGADALELEQFLFELLAEKRIVNRDWNMDGHLTGGTEFFKEDVLWLDHSKN